MSTAAKEKIQSRHNREKERGVYASSKDPNRSRSGKSGDDGLKSQYHRREERDGYKDRDYKSHHRDRERDRGRVKEHGSSGEYYFFLNRIILMIMICCWQFVSGCYIHLHCLVFKIEASSKTGLKT